MLYLNKVKFLRRNILSNFVIVEAMDAARAATFK
jgi:hypothetical protein